MGCSWMKRRRRKFHKKLTFVYDHTKCKMVPTNIQYKYRWKYKYRVSARMSSPDILRKTGLVQGSTTGSRKQWEAMTFFASQWSIIMSLATMLECYLEPYETDLALGSFGNIFLLGQNLIPWGQEWQSNTNIFVGSGNATIWQWQDLVWGN